MVRKRVNRKETGRKLEGKRRGCGFGRLERG